MELNKLEIKYFNNIELRVKNDPTLISNGGFKYEYELIDLTLNDFYEFYIDGQPLIQFFLGPKKWIGFLTDYNGVLGVSDKIYDELLIKSLLGEDVNVATIKEHFKKYDKVIDDAVAGGLIYELCLERPLIYGCKICRDRDCGGITIAVKRDPDFYCWFGYNSLTCDDEEIFRFAKLEYEDVFAQYLANWKKARTGKGDHPRVSRFPKW